MRRRLRLIPTFLAGCLALVMLGFGVYALTTPITYDINGNISYTITDTYVEVNTKIYKSEEYLTKGELADTVEQIANLNFADIESETNLRHLTTLDDTYSSLEDFSGAGEYSKGDDLDFNFATSGEDKAFAYFIVMNIANLTETDTEVYAVMKDEIVDVENTFQYNNALQENILFNEDNRNIVIGIIVDDITTPIAENSPFSYGINISSGDVARSEQMTAKYILEDDQYYWSENAKGVVVLDSAVDEVTTLFTNGGTSYDEATIYGDEITAIIIREGIEVVQEESLINPKVNKLILNTNESIQISSSFFAGIYNNECYTLRVKGSANKYSSQNSHGDELNCIIDKSTDDNVLLQGCNNTKFDLLQEEGITAIGDYAFIRCTGLTTITIPESVYTIGNDAFYYCTNLTSITIPNSVITIGNYAFSGCTSLTSITIPDSVTSIGYQAFNDCTGLTSLVIEEGEDDLEIGSEAFIRCTGLTTITIPDSVTSIGERAFSGCDSLASIVVEEGNTKYTSQIDGEETNCIIEIGEDEDENITYTVIQGCKNSIIPYGVTAIENRAFYYCTSLTSITIPDSVTSIGAYAFGAWGSNQSIYFEGTSMPENLASGWNDLCNAKIYLNGELWTGA